MEQVAGGLMSLRQRTRRTLTLVACIPDTWQLIKLRATDTVQDRFREATQLKTIPSADLGRALIEKRFAVPLRRDRVHAAVPDLAGASPSAFAEAAGFTPRQLLINIDHHVQGCLQDEEIRELDHLGDPPAVEPSPPAARAAGRR